MRRNCLQKQIIERNIEEVITITRRQGRRRKQLLDDLKETGGYCKLKENSLDHSVENSLWKRPWTCRKTDCGKNEHLLKYKPVQNDEENPAPRSDSNPRSQCLSGTRPTPTL